MSNELRLFLPEANKHNSLCRMLSLTTFSTQRSFAQLSLTLKYIANCAVTSVTVHGAKVKFSELNSIHFKRVTQIAS